MRNKGGAENINQMEQSSEVFSLNMVIGHVRSYDVIQGSAGQKRTGKGFGQMLIQNITNFNLPAAKK